MRLYSITAKLANRGHHTITVEIPAFNETTAKKKAQHLADKGRLRTTYEHTTTTTDKNGNTVTNTKTVTNTHHGILEFTEVYEIGDAFHKKTWDENLGRFVHRCPRPYYHGRFLANYLHATRHHAENITNHAETARLNAQEDFSPRRKSDAQLKNRLKNFPGDAPAFAKFYRLFWNINARLHRNNTTKTRSNNKKNTAAIAC